MNERKKPDSLLSVKKSDEVFHKDVAVSTDTAGQPDDGHATTRRSTKHTTSRAKLRLTMEKFFNAFKSNILSSEDIGMLSDIQASASDDTFKLRDREPIFVLVDSSCDSSPSSRELLIDEKRIRDQDLLRKHYYRNVAPIDMPSTSRAFCNNIASPNQDSNNEMQMIDINLLVENDISVEEKEIDEESIVVSYLQNKDAHLDLEEISETSIDVHIPSYPGSPRSITGGSLVYSDSEEAINEELRQVNEYLSTDHIYMEAAELGNDKLIEKLIREGETDLHQLDQLGRNAVHLAVCHGNVRGIFLLLEAGVSPNVKDNLGMTPLSLCLLRNPSLRIANLLFDHGAILLPRANPMDTGLFIQFVMMMLCNPTAEDEQLMELLVRKGAIVNDPDAPGGRQALHIAAMSNNTRLISKLVELGANLWMKNHRGETPLQFAAIFKCKDAVALLERLEAENRDQSSCSTTSSEGETQSSTANDSTNEVERSRKVTIKRV